MYSNNIPLVPTYSDSTIVYWLGGGNYNWARQAHQSTPPHDEFGPGTLYTRLESGAAVARRAVFMGSV
jgi:hypothetical protein